MEIAYLAHLNMGPKTGVFKKIVDQVNQWRLAGEKTGLFILTRDEEIRQALGLRATCFVYRQDSWRDRLIKMNSAINEIIQRKPDIVYLRQDHYYPVYGRLGKSLPMVLEINSDINEELREYSKVQWIYNKLFEKQLLRSCSGVVLVTNELAERKAANLINCPARVIANGVNLAESNVALPTDSAASPVLFFIGALGFPWNGFDKILRLAGSLNQFRFHLVGQTKSEISSVPPNVRCHGALAEEEYRQLLSESDVAISTLALHRKRMDEACPLKTREYLAYGLPVIIGYKDTDFPENQDFLLRLENREDNIEQNLGRIRDFVTRWKGRRVPRESVRQIDSLYKEKERIGFFKTVVGRQ